MQVQGHTLRVTVLEDDFKVTFPSPPNYPHSTLSKQSIMLLISVPPFFLQCLAHTTNTVNINPASCVTPWPETLQYLPKADRKNKLTWCARLSTVWPQTTFSASISNSPCHVSAPVTCPLAPDFPSPECPCSAFSFKHAHHCSFCVPALCEALGIRGRTDNPFPSGVLRSMVEVEWWTQYLS